VVRIRRRLVVESPGGTLGGRLSLVLCTVPPYRVVASSKPRSHCAAAGLATKTSNKETITVRAPQYMTRLIQPFVMLLSPFTNQLKPGYKLPKILSSTALPTSSSFVFIQEIMAS